MLRMRLRLRERLRALRPLAPFALLGLAALVWGITRMRWYGVTFDSPALFYAGDRTLFAMLHPANKAALDLTEVAVDPAGFHRWFEVSPDLKDPQHYPVFPGLVCAITNAIFHDKLHWVDPIDGHHLGLVLLHAIAL